MKWSNIVNNLYFIFHYINIQSNISKSFPFFKNDFPWNSLYNNQTGSL